LITFIVLAVPEQVIQIKLLVWIFVRQLWEPVPIDLAANNPSVA
jgi:hypothetical protein